MSLLTDPAAVALVRALLAAGREQGATHRNTHLIRVAVRIWQVGDVAVYVQHHRRTYLTVRNTRTGHVRMEQPVTSVQQVADLLHAVGLAPVELTSGWKAAAQLPDGVTVTEYTVSLLPEADSSNYRHYRIQVQYKGGGLWAVVNEDKSLATDGSGGWAWERGYGRDERRALFRFPTHSDALAAALAAAPHVEVGGRTAGQVLGEGGGAQ